MRAFDSQWMLDKTIDNFMDYSYPLVEKVMVGEVRSASVNIYTHGTFDKEEYVYFVHSYYVPVNEHTAAETRYILPFSAALHKDNFYATQFHPEKSGSVGERILKNFLEL